MNMIEKFCRDGFVRPVYLSLVARANLSRHTGKPILEEANLHYGYWATRRDLSRGEVIKYLGAEYLRNMK